MSKSHVGSVVTTNLHDLRRSGATILHEALHLLTAVYERRNETR